jgi:uncharacterized protein (DUF1697 family)
MKTVASVFEAAGCERVKTYIQSGNVVFEGGRVQEVAAALSKRAGFPIAVIVRSAAELEKIVRGNPFPGSERVHVVFLADRPAKARVSALDAGRSPPDRFEVRGKEIYLDCPNGMARTKLTNAYFDSKLGTVSTVRNWRTVMKLLELTRPGSG